MTDSDSHFDDYELISVKLWYKILSYVHIIDYFPAVHPLLWFDLLFFVLYYWLVMFKLCNFCSRLCSNYEMHSLLQIHKSRVTTVFFVYSSGPSRGPGRGVRAVSASWSWNATKATKSWCKIAVRWEREKVAKDAVARIGTAQIPVTCVS